MEYVYGALLLHSAGKPVTEADLKKVVEATGQKADEALVKALVASLKGVNIDEAVTQAAVAAAPVAAPAAHAEDKKEEKKEDESKKAEEAAAGLGALFG